MVAKQTQPKDPSIQASKKIIEHYIKDMKSFEEVGHFMIDSVKVYMAGVARKDESVDMEKHVFG